jgi:hypothetical protein
MVSVSRIAVCVAAALSTLAVPLQGIAQETVVQTAPGNPTYAEPGQLEQLVAPIALYPDSLLSQVLMASTYPLEVVEAARWRQAHPDLHGAALEEAVQQEDWDPSVKSLVAFPTVLDMMNDHLRWTSDLGDAFLSQQTAVMDKVQEMRYRAQSAGNLQSTPQQNVIVAETAPRTIIRIEPAQPDVIYVPTYNPQVVYGAWAYPAYTPFYWSPPGYIAAGAIFGFASGIFVGHALWGGYDWRRHSVNVVNVTNYNRFSRTSWAGGPWRHDPGHRGAVGYRGYGPGNGYRDAGFRDGVPGNRFGSREQFRPRADAGRGDPGRVDRGPYGGERGGDRGGGHGGGRPMSGDAPAAGVVNTAGPGGQPGGFGDRGNGSYGGRGNDAYGGRGNGMQGGNGGGFPRSDFGGGRGGFPQTGPLNPQTGPLNPQTAPGNPQTAPGNFQTAPGNPRTAPGNPQTTGGSRMSSFGEAASRPDRGFPQTGQGGDGRSLRAGSPQFIGGSGRGDGSAPQISGGPRFNGGGAAPQISGGSRYGDGAAPQINGGQRFNGGASERGVSAGGGYSRGPAPQVGGGGAPQMSGGFQRSGGGGGPSMNGGGFQRGGGGGAPGMGGGGGGGGRGGGGFGGGGPGGGGHGGGGGGHGGGGRS